VARVATLAAPALAPFFALVACKRPTPAGSLHGAPATSTSSAAPAPSPRAMPAGATDAGATDAGAPLPPLHAAGWLVELRDGERIDGYVSVPEGARERRPLVVALHGGGDRPEWACGEWRGVMNGYAFIVCPRGPGVVHSSGASSLYWSSHADTKARVARALAATRDRFGAYVADGPIVLAGFSMGATEAAALASEAPSEYPRLVLVEGAYRIAPTTSFAAKYARGGQRVLFGCTTLGGCAATLDGAASLLARRGVAARVNVAGTNQHGMWDTVVRSFRRDWPWLVEGAPGWERYAPPAEGHPLPGRTTERAPADAGASRR
jgi:pimeloyl-ACP methyl ester carboxylesterase